MAMVLSGRFLEEESKMGKIPMLIDCLDRTCFLKGVGSLKEAAECIDRYRKLARFEPDIAARLLEGTGFSPVKIEELPSPGVLYCCFREGGEREGIYEDMPPWLLADHGDGKDMPCAPTWTIDGFIEMHKEGCQDPTCEGGLGDGCSH